MYHVETDKPVFHTSIYLSIYLSQSFQISLTFSLFHSHTHTHTLTLSLSLSLSLCLSLFIYIYICMCVCVCVCPFRCIYVCMYPFIQFNLLRQQYAIYLPIYLIHSYVCMYVSCGDKDMPVYIYIYIYISVPSDAYTYIMYPFI